MEGREGLAQDRERDWLCPGLGLGMLGSQDTQAGSALPWVRVLVTQQSCAGGAVCDVSPTAQTAPGTKSISWALPTQPLPLSTVLSKPSDLSPELPYPWRLDRIIPA